MRAEIGGRDSESGLSEVVGFVLIIALLMAVFSLYLTYGVPAQGRENEILHMNAVKDQFIDYKIGLDALANNNKVGTPASNSFTLGSEAAYTEGVMAFIPIMKPVSSGGTFSINRRTTEPETLNISSHSLFNDPTIPAQSFSATNQPPANPTPPSELRLFIDTTSAQPSDLSVPYGIQLTSAEVQPGIPYWVFKVNLTPRFSLTKYATYTGVDDGILTGETIHEEYVYEKTDLTISVFKMGNKTIDDYVVYSAVQSVPGNYSVNVLDEAYGLTRYIGSESITASVSNTTTPVKNTGKIRFNATDGLYESGLIPLGAVDYRSQNNYWISQEYYYQMGGVFLSQIDGNNTYKLPPAITFSMDNSNPSQPITLVTVNAVSIANPYGGSVVGGNSPVQIKTTLDSLNTFPYTDGIANTKWIRIGITTEDEQARAMWKNYFDYTAKVAGLPEETETGIAGTESYIVIHGTDAADTGDYDIKVVATNATYTALLYGVGG